MFLRNPNGAIYIVDATGKRGITAGEWAGYSGATFQNVDPSVLDAIPDSPTNLVQTIFDVVATPLPNQAWPAIQTKLDAVISDIKALPLPAGPTDLTPVLTAVANLQTELDAIKALDSAPVTVPAPVVDLSPVINAISALKTEIDAVKAWQDQPWYSRLFK